MHAFELFMLFCVRRCLLQYSLVLPMILHNVFFLVVNTKDFLRALIDIHSCCPILGMYTLVDLYLSIELHSS